MVAKMADRKIPKFENEAEEAKWWFKHRDGVAAALVSALRRGASGEGSVARRERKLREANAARSKSAPDRSPAIPWAVC